MATTTTANASATLPNYYSKLFLERLQAGPIMMDYVMQQPLPQNSGTVMFFPRMTVTSTLPNTYKITEGTIITPETFSATAITATILQFANAKGVTDLTELTAISSTVSEVVKELADQASNVLDREILQVAYGASAFVTPSNQGFSVVFGNIDLVASTSAGPTYAGTGEFGMSTAVMRRWTKKLRARNVMPFDDDLYALIVHSDTEMNLQSDTTWQNSYFYTDPENPHRGVFGKYGGVKVVTDNNIFQSANGSASATLSYSLLLGRGALGASMLSGGIQTFTKRSGDQTTSDPVNQLVTFGWKANFVPVILNVSCGLIIATADSN
jgi:N4-gp56 family major capsid protein